MVAKVLVEGARHNVKAPEYVKFFQEHWQPYFGNPEVLRFDAEGTWRSRELDDEFSKLKIMLDPIPGDAHWHLSPLERGIEWLKELLTRLAQDEPKTTSVEVVSHAVSIWNQREMTRGYSPYQHALGQAPDLDGRFFTPEIDPLPIELMENPAGEHQRQHEARIKAEQTFLRWQSKERVNRALQSRSRPVPMYCPGELVFYWRHQFKNEAAGKRHQTHSTGGYAGPARVLA